MSNPLGLTSLSQIDSTIAKLDPSESLAWALAHCAQSIQCSMTSYPKLRSGLFRATIGPIAKRSFIKRSAMKHDLSAPVPGAPELVGISFEDARSRLVKAIAEFAGHDGLLAPHLAFGPCTKSEYDTLHALHIGDHLSSFVA